MRQTSLFDGSEAFTIDKTIRLIELFAGYGSQALALKYLNVPFEHWKIAEWAVKSIQAYKDLHFADDNTDYSADKTFAELVKWLTAKGISANYNEPMTEAQVKRLGEKAVRTIYNNIIATHNLVSVCNVRGEDLEITDTDKFCYLLTYSFPCQDLSNAGKGAGMEKGSGTRSGLLWEIERILSECRELPQVLIMENVPEVHGSKNVKHFAAWLQFLESIGYKNYWQDLNAKDFGIPQNRNRCFCVSILGDYLYVFPDKLTCDSRFDKRLKDVLEREVDGKYYLSDALLESYAKYNDRQEKSGNGFKFEPTGGGTIAKAITTRAGSRPCDNYVQSSANAEEKSKERQTLQQPLMQETTKVSAIKGKQG